MPNYNFKNNETGEEFEEFFTMSGREEYLKENPDFVNLNPEALSQINLKH